jgi:monofunctional biosynthetic peptidoglycan transglycosylase
MPKRWFCGRSALLSNLGRALALLVLCTVALQLAFFLRIAAMRVIDPESTAFERSEAWRLLVTKGRIEWSQTWVPISQISPHLQRAVIASEDDDFLEHGGIDWDAIESAWERNQRAEARAQAQARRSGRARAGAVPKVVGGSTITQQLAKNLLLSGERTLLRKGQEAVLTLMIEAVLPKQRILEIYLNHAEWGEGVFGAQAAARHYHRVDAARLGPEAAARLAVMLPAPKLFERRPNSAYVAQRAGTIVARMRDVTLP